MTEKLSDVIDRVQQANVMYRRQLELAEAQVPPLNDALTQLANLGLGNGHVILGDILHTNAYPAGTEAGSGQVHQAAVIIPGGIGVAVWDSAEYDLFRRGQDDLEIEARNYFVPFDLCNSAIKAMLFPCVEQLVKGFLQEIGLGSLLDITEVPTT